MPLNSCIEQLKSNTKPIYEEALRLLVTIADNIIKDPSNLKIRNLNKSNVTISTKILAVNGGRECLKLMGFIENETSLSIPRQVNDLEISGLKLVREALLNSPSIESKEKSQNQAVHSCETSAEVEIDAESSEELNKPIKRVVLPPCNYIFIHPFLKQIELRFHGILIYENEELQERARKLIPLHQFEVEAQKHLRALQAKVKKGDLDDPQVSLQDFIILELLSWFKNNFFKWVDSPNCYKCGGKTHMSHMSDDPKLLLYTNRVEMHLCDSCQVLTPFPRYNDLNILMETRSGRCGEWANVFTLFCRALRWDTRHVVDETDHVWTEVYSFAQERWLHCDPCENACDTPLIYESGWGKKLSYVIAYSCDDVQDVTWRYSSDHGEVLRRRNNCSELELVDAIVKLRINRQKDLSEGRKKYLARRVAMELVELMTEKTPQDAEMQGRISGSLGWRLSRGETQESTQHSSHMWLLKNARPNDLTSVTLRYSSALDLYELISASKVIQTKNGWQSGVFEHSGVFRKEERDWKMVYLARKEKTSEGTVKWKFSVTDSNIVIDKVDLIFKTKLYENGAVIVTMSNESRKVFVAQERIITTAFSGSSGLVLDVQLKGGKGNVAWQHAQLFRETMDNYDPSFHIVFTFKRK